MVQDRRIQRTQQGLAEALIALCLEKGYAAVSIRDIAERAGVGYATFFRHYPDKEALLSDVFDVILAELLDLLRSAQPVGRGHEVGALLFGFVARHSEVCRALLSSRGPAALRDRIVAAGTANILAENQPQPGSGIPPAVAAHHLAAASMALIQWWLDHDMPYPAERMGQIYEDLVTRPTVALSFMPVEPGSSGSNAAPERDAEQ